MRKTNSSLLSSCKQSKNNYTALHLAAQNGYAEIVALLMDKGAKIYQGVLQAAKNDEIRALLRKK
jgi:ankyrin repeat protein